MLALLGVIAASTMVGASVTIAATLNGGFDRTAQRAGLPDVLATFSSVQRAQVAHVVSELPNIRGASYYYERGGVRFTDGRNYASAKLYGVTPGGRHGYGIVAGHDVSGPGQVVVEAGIARAWHLHIGQLVSLQYYLHENFRIVGIAISPETVAYPLTNSPHVYSDIADARRLESVGPGLVDGVDLWLADPRLVDMTLAQARSASFGVRGLQLVTRDGLRLLIGQAAGIVIAVVVAFSLIALLVACVMLSASAAAEVQRRLTALGLLRAVGVSARTLVAAAAVEATMFALPAATLGVLGGWLATQGSANRLLDSLNQLPPGSSLVLLLAASIVGLTLLVVAATCWPAWRATRRSPVEVLRGGDVGHSARNLPLPPVFPLLGVRLVLARPARAAATVTVVGFAVSVVLTILTIATVLQNLNSQPLSVGKRYQLVVYAPASQLQQIRQLPGVAAATPFLSLEVADSFALDEPFTLEVFGAPPQDYEAPPLVSGNFPRRVNEVEVGVGLAEALGLHPGGALAVQLPDGREVRFRIAGIVQALENQGRVAYVQSPGLLGIGSPPVPPVGPGTTGQQGPTGTPFRGPGVIHGGIGLGFFGYATQIAVKLRPSASSAAVTAALARKGHPSSSSGGIAGQSVQGWAARSSGFIGILVALLRTVAILDACVCLYAVGQALALTSQERRRALAVIRAQGAGQLHLFAVFGVVAGFLVLLAWALAAGLERWAVAPGVAHLAASYVVLALAAGGQLLLLTLGGLLLGAAVVSALLVRSILRQPVVTGLRTD